MGRTNPMRGDRSVSLFAALIVFMVATVACGLRVGAPGLIEPDEGRYAAVGRSMWESRDFITPRINGFVYLDKPPLLHWLTALSIGCLGPSEFAVRLSSLLSSAACVALVYAFGRYVQGGHVGVASAIILSSSLMWFAVARVIRYDMLLTLAITATIWWAWLGFEVGRKGRGRFYAAALAAGLGVLAKGPIALALPVLVMLPYLTVTGRLRALLTVPWLGVIGILIVIILPWFVLCERENPGTIRFFIFHENLARVRGAIDAGHHEPWWYFCPVVLCACLPWTMFLPGALVDAVCRTGYCDISQRRAFVLCLLWLVIPIAFFSVSRVKVATYVLPSLPPAALLIGRYISPPRYKGRWAAIATGVLLCVAGIAATYCQYQPPLAIPMRPIAALLGFGGIVVTGGAALGARKWAVATTAICALGTYYLALWNVGNDPSFPSDREIARHITEVRKPGERLFSVQRLSRGCLFYLNDRLAVFGNPPAEYDFPGNRDRLGEWVYPLEDAGEVLSKTRPALIICRSSLWDEFRAVAGDYVTPIAETPRILLLRSRPHGRSTRAGNYGR